MTDCDPKSKMVKARFKLSNCSNRTQSMPLGCISEQLPTRMSDLEKEFLRRHPDEFELVGRHINKKK